MRMTPEEFREKVGATKPAFSSMPVEEYHRQILGLADPQPEAKQKGKNKYGAKRTEYNGQEYDSAKEATHAQMLDLHIKAGIVRRWERQKTIKIIINKIKITDYRADFKVFYMDGRIEYHDVKGYKAGIAYRMFTIKRDLIKALYGVDILEK